VTVVEQVLTGTFADGLGNIRKVPDRIGFEPFPWHSMAVWILTQMRRWGQLKEDVDYRGVATQVFLAANANRAMTEAGLSPPSESFEKHVIMGKVFDPAKPKEYIDSFAIRRG